MGICHSNIDSIVDKNKRCFICGTTQFLEVHHIMAGANRDKSTKYKLVVYLCSDCHRNGKNAAHRNRVTDLMLKEAGQRAFEREYPELDFLKIFHRNYL